MSILGGGGNAREFVLKIIADVKDAVKGVDDVADKTTGMKDKMMGIGKAVAGGLAAAGVIEFGKSIVNAAADADDAMDATAIAFGNGAKEIEKFSKSAADSMGLSSTAYMNMAAKTGELLKGMGVDTDTAVASTEKLTQRAADMAAIWGGSTEDAMNAINKALTGTTKPLKAYGVTMSKADIEARAMAKGYVDASGKVTEAGMAIAAQELVLEQTSDVQGAFADNSKDLGSQQDILKAKFENIQTTMGNQLLPIIVKLMSLLQPLMNLLAENADILGPLAIAIGVVVAATWAWNAALAANPISLIVLAIAALVAGIILAYQKVGWFHDLIDMLWQGIQAGYNWVKDNWPLLVAIITGPIGTAVLLVVKNWDTIKDAFSAVWDFIKQIMGTVYDVLTAPYRMAFDAIKTLIGNIPQWFRDLVTLVGNALSTVWTVISDPFKKGWDAAKSAGQVVIDWLGTLRNGINNAFSGIYDVLTYPFKTAFQAIKTLWNNTVGGFGFEIPSWVPGVGGKSFKIPKMAKGGVVNRPTIALIGEAGPEAVVPLSMLAAAPTGGTTVTLNVYALAASAEVGRQVLEALREYERISGKNLLVA